MFEKENKRLVYLTLLISYTILSIILGVESIVMHWEFWPIVLLVIGVIVNWALHITEGASGEVRIWISFLMSMVGFFYYGTHRTSFFDLAPTIIIMILVFSVIESSKFIILTMLTYYVTMAYALTGIVMEGVTFDSLVISRTVFHCIVVFMSGYLMLLILKARRKQQEDADQKIIELKEINTRTEDFLANVSHELRTPINAVTGITAVLMKDETDPEKRENIASIQNAGYRLFEQIEDILDYTEIDAGKLNIAHEKYIITSLVNDIITEKRIKNGKKNVELIFDTDVRIPSVLVGDSKKIKKIIVHLIDNAMKFTKRGGVYVRLYTIQKNYGVNLCIHVVDTGIGMTEEELERVQDGFYQSNASRSRRAGGLGLGLSVACGMVHALGGFIQFKSKKGEGTAISISIPQEVHDTKPIMKLDKPEKLCLAAYLMPDKYQLPQVREYYNRIISHIVRGLDIELHRVYSLDELKRLDKVYQLTHLFIADEEYSQDEKYFEEMQSRSRVIVVASDKFSPKAGSQVSIIKKPLSTLPIISVLNSEASLPNGGLEVKRMTCHGARVLVVDDEPMNLLVAQGMLKNYGIEVKNAGSGKQAIEICEKEDFDLIFLDHMMPEMDGVETLHHLRNLRANEKTPLKVVAFTANAMSSARQMFLEEGFNDFISKPIEITELERVLKRMLPEEKIQYVDMENSAIPIKEERDYEQSIARSVDINQDAAIGFCGGDKNFYLQLIQTYLDERDEKKEKMDQFLAEKDLKNYQIYVHGLKSASRMVGADDLSAHAKSLEDASREGDLSKVQNEHEILMKEYWKVCTELRKIAGIDENSETVDSETSSDLLPAISPSLLQEKLTALQSALSTYSFDTVDLILKDLERTSYEGMNLVTFAREIRKFLDDFETDKASEVVEELLEKVSKNQTEKPAEKFVRQETELTDNKTEHVERKHREEADHEEN